MASARTLSPYRDYDLTIFMFEGSTMTLKHSAICHSANGIAIPVRSSNVGWLVWCTFPESWNHLSKFFALICTHRKRKVADFLPFLLSVVIQNIFRCSYLVALTLHGILVRFWNTYRNKIKQRRTYVEKGSSHHSTPFNLRMFTLFHWRNRSLWIASIFLRNLIYTSQQNKKSLPKIRLKYKGNFFLSKSPH